MPNRRLYRDRAAWGVWAGTATEVARLATAAETLVETEAEHPASTLIRVEARVFEGDFLSPEAFVADLTGEDIADVESIDIRVEGASQSGQCRVSLRIERPARRSGDVNYRPDPVVRLSVAGHNGAWVQRATRELSIEVEKGIPGVQWVARYAFWIGAAAAALGGVALGIAANHSPSWSGEEIFGLSLLLAGLAVLGAALVVTVATPFLELLPEGHQSRWQRIRPVRHP